MSYFHRSPSSHCPHQSNPTSRTLHDLLSSEVPHGRKGFKGHIFHPLGHLLNSSAVKVPVYLGLSLALAAKHDELMGSEAVILLYPTTVSIAHFLSLSLVPYTVLPVVFIGQATPGQAREPESPSGFPSRPFSFRLHWEYPSFPLLKDPHRCIFPDAPKLHIDQLCHFILPPILWNGFPKAI